VVVLGCTGSCSVIDIDCCRYVKASDEVERGGLDAVSDDMLLLQAVDDGSDLWQVMVDSGLVGDEVGEHY